MDFYEVLEKRRSFRSYDPARAVPDAAIRRLADAVLLAPTACNRQPVRILLVRNPELRRKICAVYPPAWLESAPAIAVLLGDSSQAWKRLEGDSIIDVDAAIVMEHFVLAAAAEGLGTCWICAFPRAAMDTALNLAAPWHTVAISPLGYADPESCRANSHKDTNEIFQVID